MNFAAPGYLTQKRDSGHPNPVLTLDQAWRNTNKQFTRQILTGALATPVWNCARFRPI
jgi:hypothetical protein